MVAITVILAAVIGTFVLGLGDQIGDSAPNANWDAEFDSATNETTFTHNGGDSIDRSTLRLSVSGEIDFRDGADDHGGDGTLTDPVDDPLTAGSSITAELEGEAEDSGTVNLVWESGDRSSILRSIDVELSH